jgi:Metallo-peptidase family M12
MDADGHVKGIGWQIRLIATLLCIAAWFVVGRAQQAELFRDALPSSADAAADQLVVRSRAVIVDLRQMLIANDASATASSLLLNLFENAQFSAIRDRVDRTANGFVWVGRIPDIDRSTVTLAVEGSIVYGTILTPDAVFLIQPLRDGIHAIRQIDQRLLPPEAPLREPPVAPSLGRESVPDQGLLDDASFIDVMVLYTPAAAAAAGGSSAINALANNAISTTNTTYANSGITQRVRLVYSGVVSYTEAGASGLDIDTDLNNLTNGTSGLGGVASLRDTYRADLVSMLTHTPTSPYCGIAWLMSSPSTSFERFGYSVVEQSCAVAALSFPHELGHNMGARHDWYMDSGTTPYTYAHGYVNTTSRWRTVMSYNNICAVTSPFTNCTRLAYWSNPSATFGGAPMGVPGGTNSSSGCYANPANPPCDADDHRTLNNTAAVVANFRQNGPAPLTVSSLTSNSQQPVAGTPVTWSAGTTGGAAPYTYQFWVSDGTKWSLGRDWSASNSFSWMPLLSGTYHVQVWARNAGSSAVDAWRDSGAVNVAAPGVLTLTGVLPSPSSATAGSPVTWTAYAAGCVQPCSYQFFLFDGASWSNPQGWSTSSTWTWTPPAAGTYTVQVWARHAGAVTAFDAWRASAPFTVGVPSSLTVTSFFSSSSFSVPAGTTVTWDARAISGVEPYSFRFWVFDGSLWSIGQDWSPSSTWTWTPATAGTYSFQVWARNSGSGATFDAWRGGGPLVVGPPTSLSLSSVTADRSFPVSAGTPVSWKASAMGGSGPYTFRFWVFDGIAWTLGRDWSPANTWTWVPSSPGNYSFQVWARNAGSSSPFDAWIQAGPAAVSAPSALAVTSLTTSPAQPLVVGGPASVTAIATGGTGPYTYKFWVFNGSTWTVGQDWSAASSWRWKPAAAGSYQIQVWVRNSESLTTLDAWSALGPIAVIP